MAGPDEEGGEENGTGSRNSRNMEVNGNRSVGDSYVYPILVCIYLHCIINVHVNGISIL